MLRNEKFLKNKYTFFKKVYKVSTYKPNIYFNLNIITTNLMMKSVGN